MKTNHLDQFKIACSKFSIYRGPITRLNSEFTPIIDGVKNDNELVIRARRYAQAFKGNLAHNMTYLDADKEVCINMSLANFIVIIFCTEEVPEDNNKREEYKLKVLALANILFKLAMGSGGVQVQYTCFAKLLAYAFNLLKSNMQVVDIRGRELPFGSDIVLVNTINNQGNKRVSGLIPAANRIALFNKVVEANPYNAKVKGKWDYTASVCKTIKQAKESKNYGKIIVAPCCAREAFGDDDSVYLISDVWNEVSLQYEDFMLFIHLLDNLYTSTGTTEKGLKAPVPIWKEDDKVFILDYRRFLTVKEDSVSLTSGSIVEADLLNIIAITKQISGMALPSECVLLNAYSNAFKIIELALSFVHRTDVEKSKVTFKSHYGEDYKLNVEGFNYLNQETGFKLNILNSNQTIETYLTTSQKGFAFNQKITDEALNQELVSRKAGVYAEGRPDPIVYNPTAKCFYFRSHIAKPKEAEKELAVMFMTQEPGFDQQSKKGGVSIDYTLWSETLYKTYGLQFQPYGSMAAMEVHDLISVNMTQQLAEIYQTVLLATNDKEAAKQAALKTGIRVWSQVILNWSGDGTGNALPIDRLNKIRQEIKELLVECVEAIHTEATSTRAQDFVVKGSNKGAKAMKRVLNLLADCTRGLEDQALPFMIAGVKPVGIIANTIFAPGVNIDAGCMMVDYDFIHNRSAHTVKGSSEKATWATKCKLSKEWTANFNNVNPALLELVEQGIIEVVSSAKGANHLVLTFKLVKAINELPEGIWGETLIPAPDFATTKKVSVCLSGIFGELNPTSTSTRVQEDTVDAEDKLIKFPVTIKGSQHVTSVNVSTVNGGNVNGSTFDCQLVYDTLFYVFKTRLGLKGMPTLANFEHIDGLFKFEPQLRNANIEAFVPKDVYKLLDFVGVFLLEASMSFSEVKDDKGNVTKAVDPTFAKLVTKVYAEYSELLGISPNAISHSVLNWTVMLSISSVTLNEIAAYYLETFGQGRWIHLPGKATYDQAKAVWFAISDTQEDYLAQENTSSDDINYTRYRRIDLSELKSLPNFATIETELALALPGSIKAITLAKDGKEVKEQDTVIISYCIEEEGGLSYHLAYYSFMIAPKFNADGTVDRHVRYAIKPEYTTVGQAITSSSLNHNVAMSISDLFEDKQKGLILANRLLDNKSPRDRFLTFSYLADKSDINETSLTVIGKKGNEHTVLEINAENKETVQKRISHLTSLFTSQAETLGKTAEQVEEFKAFVKASSVLSNAVFISKLNEFFTDKDGHPVVILFPLTGSDQSGYARIYIPIALDELKDDGEAALETSKETYATSLLTLFRQLAIANFAKDVSVDKINSSLWLEDKASAVSSAVAKAIRSCSNMIENSVSNTNAQKQAIKGRRNFGIKTTYSLSSAPGECVLVLGTKEALALSKVLKVNLKDGDVFHAAVHREPLDYVSIVRVRCISKEENAQLAFPFTENTMNLFAGLAVGGDLGDNDGDQRYFTFFTTQEVEEFGLDALVCNVDVLIAKTDAIQGYTFTSVEFAVHGTKPENYFTDHLSLMNWAKGLSKAGFVVDAGGKIVRTNLTIRVNENGEYEECEPYTVILRTFKSFTTFAEYLVPYDSSTFKSDFMGNAIGACLMQTVMVGVSYTYQAFAKLFSEENNGILAKIEHMENNVLCNGVKEFTLFETFEEYASDFIVSFLSANNIEYSPVQGETVTSWLVNLKAQLNEDNAPGTHTAKIDFITSLLSNAYLITTPASKEQWAKLDKKVVTFYNCIKYLLLCEFRDTLKAFNLNLTKLNAQRVQNFYELFLGGFDQQLAKLGLAYLLPLYNRDNKLIDYFNRYFPAIVSSITLNGGCLFNEKGTHTLSDKAATITAEEEISLPSGFLSTAEMIAQFSGFLVTQVAATAQKAVDKKDTYSKDCNGAINTLNGLTHDSNSTQLLVYLTLIQQVAQAKVKFDVFSCSNTGGLSTFEKYNSLLSGNAISLIGNKIAYISAQLAAKKYVISNSSYKSLFTDTFSLDITDEELSVQISSINSTIDAQVSDDDSDDSCVYSWDELDEDNFNLVNPLEDDDCPIFDEDGNEIYLSPVANKVAEISEEDYDTFDLENPLVDYDVDIVTEEGEVVGVVKGTKNSNLIVEDSALDTTDEDILCDAPVAPVTEPAPTTVEVVEEVSAIELIKEAKTVTVEVVKDATEETETVTTEVTDDASLRYDNEVVLVNSDSDYSDYNDELTMTVEEQEAFEKELIFSADISCSDTDESIITVQATVVVESIEVEDTAKMIEPAKVDIKSSETTMKDIEAKLERAKANLSQFSSKSEELTAERIEVETQIDNLAVAQVSLSERKETLAVKLEEANAYAQKVEELRLIEEECIAIQAKNALEEQYINEGKAKVAAATAVVAKLESEVSELEEMLNSLSCSLFGEDSIISDEPDDSDESDDSDDDKGGNIPTNNGDSPDDGGNSATEESVNEAPASTPVVTPASDLFIDYTQLEGTLLLNGVLVDQNFLGKGCYLRILNFLNEVLEGTYTITTNNTNICKYLLGTELKDFSGLTFTVSSAKVVKGKKEAKIAKSFEEEVTVETIEELVVTSPVAPVSETKEERDVRLAMEENEDLDDNNDDYSFEDYSTLEDNNDYSSEDDYSATEDLEDNDDYSYEYDVEDNSYEDFNLEEYTVLATSDESLEETEAVSTTTEVESVKEEEETVVEDKVESTFTAPVSKKEMNLIDIIVEDHSLKLSFENTSALRIFKKANVVKTKNLVTVNGFKVVKTDECKFNGQAYAVKLTTKSGLTALVITNLEIFKSVCTLDNVARLSAYKLGVTLSDLVSEHLKVAINLDYSIKSHVGDLEVVNGALLRKHSSSIVKEISKHLGNDAQFTIIANSETSKAFFAEALANEILNTGIKYYDKEVELDKPTLWGYLLKVNRTATEFDAVVTLSYDAKECYVHASDIPQIHYNIGSKGIDSCSLKFCN